ncbi:class I SAM-dependent DNA methyltransferase [Micromonospora sp. SH-82]|uniref:class I SAM-dependent DNA methyltransferase n=1 Tax=Micromonospora sp. SH-82 TaxID=3132938 RepID=UPI003EBD273B
MPNSHSTTSSTDVAPYERADIYHDFYHGRGKGYRAEADALVEIARKHTPQASTLLDVACGTGSHLVELADSFREVVGVDLSAAMLATAARNDPARELHQGDMRDFSLDRRFDVVTCMFSSTGYLVDEAELDRAVANLAGHLAPGGTLVVEPWWFPETFRPGWVGADLVTTGDRRISRMSHTVPAGLPDRTASQMTIHYTVGSPEAGIEHFTEVHVMTLFARAAYEQAFQRAGLSCSYVGHDLFSPGLFVGVAAEPGR